jgi:hypothetical protein
VIGTTHQLYELFMTKQVVTVLSGIEQERTCGNILSPIVWRSTIESTLND